MLLFPPSSAGVQVPGRLLLLQHGEDDLRGHTPGICAHLKVREGERKKTCVKCSGTRFEFRTQLMVNLG